MEEIINSVNAVMFALDNIHIRGRITENAAAYNEIIGCINTLAKVQAKLQKEQAKLQEIDTVAEETTKEGDAP